MRLRLFHDFDPGLSGTFEDEINFQKWSMSWNDISIRFVEDFITWCARRPMLFEAEERITPRLASTFGAYRNEHIQKWWERSNLILKNVIIYFRVFTGWLLSGCIRKWSFFDHRIKSWRGWWSKTLHLHLMSNHSIISSCFGLCHIDDASWAAFCVKVKFLQNKKHKNGSLNFFLSEMHNDQSTKKLPHLPRISNNVEI